LAVFKNNSKKDTSPVEQVLMNLGIRYERTSVRLSETRWPKANQIREVDPKKDIDRARAIASAIKNRGIQPPPLVISRTGLGIDGYGRKSAYELLGVDDVEAFRLLQDYDDNAIKQLQIQLNTVHGQRPTDAEMMGLIVHQRDVYGTEFKALADMFGVSDSKVSALYYREKLSQRLASLRQPADGIKQDAARELIKIKRDATLIQAARLAREASMTVEQVKVMLIDIEAADSDSDEIVAVEKHRTHLNEQIVGSRMGRKIVQPTNGVTIWKHLRAITAAPSRIITDVPSGKREKHLAYMVEARDRLDGAITDLRRKKVA